MGWSDFTKEKKIGEGSFGAAWLVKGNKDGIQYVIKIINVSRMPTKEREEARKEVAVLAQMKHPNIVSYIDSFEESGNLCIVMDYCDGGDLYNKIHSTRGVPYSEDQIIDWFVQITLALKHVHDRKILHRDLKTQNIFLTGDGVVKLGDFGVAKVLSNTMELARTSIGTPYYMSPELVEHKPYNNKSDVWSLGCVLYELTSMKHPFTANNMQQLAYKILRGAYEPISSKFSYDLRNLIASMLKLSPRERPSVNGVLRKAFIMKRCEKFLTNEKLKEEFSHTVLHGENFARKIANLNFKQPKRSLEPAKNMMIVGQPSPSGAPATPKAVYDPSKIYGAPVVRRSGQQLRQSVEKRNQIYMEMKKKQAGNNRASPTPTPQATPISNQVSTPRKSSQSFLEQMKEKKMKEEAALRLKQKDLAEKQKHDRLKRAAEQGWKNVLFGQTLQTEQQQKRIDKPEASKPINEKNIYYRHLKALEERKKSSNPNLGPRKYAISNSASDFKERREEFVKNRIRAQGVGNHLLPGAGANNNKVPIIKANEKKDEKSDYEERLRRIRMQNFNNRKIQYNEVKKIEEDRAARLERIDALRKQAKCQQMKLDYELEMKRMKRLNKEINEVQKLPDVKPEPSIRMTEVFNAIGIQGKKVPKEEALKEICILYPQVQYSPRKGWQKATNMDHLENKTIVQQTVHAKNIKKAPQISPRKVWDLPHETIIKAFELADLSPSTSVKSNESKQNMKKCDTFVIQNGTEEEKEHELKPLFSPEKLATLKATKNLLLGVTLGQFDLKSTKMLRTCSEPDMTKLSNIDEENNAYLSDVENNKDIAAAEKQVPSLKGTLFKSTLTNRLVKSLEDLVKSINNCVGRSTESEDMDDIDSDNFVHFEDDEDGDDESNDINESHDLDEMVKLLESVKPKDDSDDEGRDKISNKKDSPRKGVSFVRDSRLVQATTIDPVDSLDVTNTNGDEVESNDNNDEDSDTEFEDDLIVTTILNSSNAEETRISLENELGTKEFVKAYPLIEKLVLKEHKDKVKTRDEKKSYEMFAKLFPNAVASVYDKFNKLILNDNDLDQ